MAGISSKAALSLENKEKTFQGQRFDDELDLDWYQFKWRNYDAQIGRFIEIDPLADKYTYNSPYNFSEDKVTTHVELEGLEAEYIFSQAKKEIANTFQGAANTIDRAISYFNKSSTSTVGAVTPVTTTSTGTTVTTTVSTNLGGNTQYIIANNSNAGNTEPLTKTTISITADTKTDIKTPIGTLSNKTSISDKGVVTNETGARTTIPVEGVPVNVLGSVTKGSDGKTSLTAQASSGTGNVQGIGQAKYTTNGKDQSVSIGVGGQTTAGKTTVTTLFGLNFNW